MSDRLVAVVMFLYLLIAIGYGREAKWGLALAFAAYGIANVGLILASRGY